MSGKTFIRITNQNIYDKLVSIEKSLGKTKGIVTAHTLAISIIVIILVAVISRVV